MKVKYSGLHTSPFYTERIISTDANGNIHSFCHSLSFPIERKIKREQKMAKRSDLSQKLLDDLRMRKEKMAMSHTSSYSNQMHKGGNFRKPMQGSRPVNTRETVISSFSLSCTPDKLLFPFPSMSSFGEPGTLNILGDLSMALAFALENGGTLRQLTSSGNPMLGFLQHIGRSVDFVQMDRSSSSSSLVKSRPSNSRFPTLSHLHIKEISKGAQKLNQILNACSNGLNFDRYSMDIGKELLKGAMELEESLRMLVNLQEASEYVISPQRKQRIRLLEEEDDDETTIEVNHRKQVNGPKFSFKGPTRSSPEDAQVTKVGLLKQRLLALSYPTEAAQFSSNNHTSTTSSSSVSRRRSPSCGPDSSTLTASSEPRKQSNTSQSKTGKGRIPNVIAKLMGLEELPPNTNPKNGAEKGRILKPDKVSKDAKQTPEGRFKKEERTLMDNKSPSERTQTPRPQGLHANIHATPGSGLGPVADKILVPHNGSLEFMFHLETPHLRGPKYLENLNLISNSKPTSKISRPQMMNTNQLSKISGIHQDKHGKEEKSDPRDWKAIKKGVNSEAFLDDLQRMAPQAKKHQEATDYKQDKGIDKQHHKEKKNADNFYMSSNQQKAPHKSGSQQPREFESQGEKLHEDEIRRHNTTGKLQVNNPKVSGALLKDSPKPKHDTSNLQKKLPRMNHAMAGERSPRKAFGKMPSEGSRKKSQSDDLISDGVTPNKLGIDSLYENSEAQADNDVKRIATSPQRMLSEALHVQLRQEKLSSRDMHKRVNSKKRDGKVDEVVTRKKRSTNNTGQPLKQQISILQQLKHRKAEETHKSKEAETSINISRKAKARETMNLVPHGKSETSSTFNNHVGDSCQSLREMGATAPHAITNDKTSGVSNSLRGPEPMLDKDEAVPSFSVSVQLKVASGRGMLGIFNSSQMKDQKSLGEHSLLDENESRLKQILLRSQIFLNTAEALFGLLIPIDILHSSAKTCKDDDSKLVLDCCYEVMKRKGRRKEITFNPCVRIPVRSVKLKGLDDLVKELHEDLEELKFLNQDSGNENDTALYLHRMLERDIQNKNPDLNCMWDFGWGETLFGHFEKVEVIRDVEKFVLNGLIDEILEDIL
ncbi:uncharacterized protein LOC122084827 [Macadamia integrifolia]|uniref:uncharacterized protein LOC122084827 n=1 Tax=Macadamia integrifolia TaxID=60698 RepID=UPI001C4FB9B0|nr:uncharacterized protein LOC122084827 [Macadamia integrifolia]